MKMNKKMKNVMLSLATVALLGSQAVLAQVNITAGNYIRFSDGPGAGNGGAFNITSYGADSTGSAPNAVGSFLSFCVEHNEYMNFSNVFRVDGVSTAAKNGGVGGAVAGQDPLDVRTAWLYTQYIESPSALGAVSGWNAASLVDKGTAMQQAVWFLEQEIAFGSMNTLASALVTAANGSGWTDVGRVKILNIKNLSGGVAQDQLYITPVPEPEIYAMMGLGLGLMGFMARRRKQAAV
jgi:hypothetical protein